MLLGVEGYAQTVFFYLDLLVREKAMCNVVRLCDS